MLAFALFSQSVFALVAVESNPRPNTTVTASTMAPTGVIQKNVPLPQVLEFSVFSRKDCTHCIALEKFLSSRYGSGTVRPKYYDLADAGNYALFEKFTAEK